MKLRQFMPFYALGSSEARIFGISVFGYRDVWWHEKFVMPTYRVAYSVDRFVYEQLKCRFGPRSWRHHIVYTDLKPGWTDADEVMFRACFAILRRFVEWELGKPSKDWPEAYRGYRVHSAGGHDEKAIDLWLWYKEELPKLYAEEHEAYLKQTPGWYKIDDEIEKVKSQKLAELIEMRRTLWT